MDWGLMSFEGENKFLRDEIVYSSTVSVDAFIQSFATQQEVSSISVQSIISESFFKNTFKLDDFAIEIFAIN